MRKERKNYSAEEKVAILRRHLLDKVPVSDLCEELGLQPTVFYRWQKDFFENGRPPSKRRNLLAARLRKSRNGTSSWRRRYRPRTRYLSWCRSPTCKSTFEHAARIRSEKIAVCFRTRAGELGLRSSRRRFYIGLKDAQIDAHGSHVRSGRIQVFLKPVETLWNLARGLHGLTLL
jgi:transposase-like protein